MTAKTAINDDAILKIGNILKQYCHVDREHLIDEKISGLPIDSIDFVEIIFEIEEILGLEIEVENIDFDTSIMQLVLKCHE